MTAKAKKDAYQAVTDKIIELLNQGIVPWYKPWHCVGVLPYNVASKKSYNGMNLILLGAYSGKSPVWGTFKQWKDKGGFVRKGEKGMPVIFWKFLDQKENGQLVYDSKGRVKKIPLIRYSTVFNATQIDGIDIEDYIPKESEVIREFTPIEKAEKILENMPNKPEICFDDNNRAFYSPVADYINMPEPELFKNDDRYYNVLFHEMTHSTGHPSRVGRELSQLEEKYSFEELIAELGACFLSTESGVEIDIENSASYIDGWLKRLKSDKKFIVRAASAAKKASEYILNNK